eukprot:TRINITY_DN986_c0_g1_i2.p1 TRINITY_DN986_c0_g1~~TRINITY_DN986_c0_g1_i2.p1  ORF type:complete len:398 (-),score=14.89 TRINITY_DN986_c0_g1_i2:147-1340(-)
MKAHALTHSNKSRYVLVNHALVNLMLEFDRLENVVDGDMLVQCLFAWQQRRPMFSGWRRGSAVDVDADYAFYCWLANSLCTKPRYLDRFLPLAADLLVDGLRTPNVNFRSDAVFTEDVMKRCFENLRGYKNQLPAFCCALAAKGAYDLLLQMQTVVVDPDGIAAMLCIQYGVWLARHQHDITHVPDTDVAALLRLMAAYIEKNQHAGCSFLFYGGLGIFSDAFDVLQANIEVFICSLLSEFESATCDEPIVPGATALLNLMLFSFGDPMPYGQSIEQRLAFQSANKTPAFRLLLSLVKRSAKKKPEVQGKMMVFVNRCRAVLDADHPTIRLFLDDPVCKRFVCALPACRTHECDDFHRLGTLALKACAQCRAAYYCDRECQTAHWNKHKKRCKSTLN